MYITVDQVAGGFVWRLHAYLKRTVCVSAITFPKYDTAVKDAKRFRSILGAGCNILYDTPTGKVKVT